MELVCFIVLHYKDIDTTDRCVQSILCMRHQARIRIVVVDNDIDEVITKRDKLKSKYSDIENVYVVQINENGGFSYANNIGYMFARNKLGASFILVVNNDIEFIQTDFLDKLIESYKEYRCHVLGPDIIKRTTGEHQNPLDIRIRTLEEAKYTIQMNQIALDWYTFLYPVLYLRNRLEEKRQLRSRSNELFYTKVQYEVVPFGACFIFTPLFVKNEEKAFDPETYFYYEEYILALQCARKGYHITYDPSLSVLHESGALTKKSMRSERKRLRFVMERIIQACKVYLSCLEKN